MAGRPAKPLALHLLQGTARKGRIDKRKTELRLSPSSPGDPPVWYSTEARAEWDRITGDAEYKQILSSVHRSALVEYCYLHGLMIDAARDWSNSEIPPGEKRRIAASERQMLGSLRMQLGLTPASQAKVKGPPQAAEKNVWSEL